MQFIVNYGKKWLIEPWRIQYIQESFRQYLCGRGLATNLTVFFRRPPHLSDTHRSSREISCPDDLPSRGKTMREHILS